MRLSIVRPMIVFFTLVFAYLQYVLWFKEDGVFNLVHLKKELTLQIQQNEILKQQNNELYQQVEHLKKDLEVTEGRARGELGMIKKGEKFYQIIH